MIAITHGKLLTVANGTIEDGTLLIDNGKITAIGKDIAIPQGAEILDASGKWVTPGLIDAHTHISTFNEPHWMPHIGDGNEVTSPVTAQIRGIDALNPFDMAIGAARSAGFTTCYTGPGSANVIGGTGLSFKLKNAATVQEIAIEGSEMMKMALGENPKRCYGSEKKMPMTRMGTGAVLRKALFDAKQYSDALAAGKDVKRDFDLEALVPVVRGEMRCRIHCHRADERGMVRGHQFNKVEMFQYTRPEDSDAAFEELVTKAENLVKGLGFHFRTVKLAAGDCSASMARTYDIEIQIPSMNGYKEVSSVSNARDYQARRGNIRFRRAETGKIEYVHTLNGSGLATSRIFPAMVEQNQLADGSVVVPEVLRKYLGGLEVITKK